MVSLACTAQSPDRFRNPGFALKIIATRAGLTWASAQKALKNPAWRLLAETNRAEMFDLGLWGVPSFRVGSTSVWGQDRLWAIEQDLIAAL